MVCGVNASITDAIIDLATPTNDIAEGAYGLIEWNVPDPRGVKGYRVCNMDTQIRGAP